MTNSEAWEKSFVSYTEDLTKHGRRLGFAGFALAWVLRTGDFAFPVPVLLSLIGLCVFFLLDISQYWKAARDNRAWLRHQEATKGVKGDFSERPAALDEPHLAALECEAGSLGGFVSLDRNRGGSSSHRYVMPHTSPTYASSD